MHRRGLRQFSREQGDEIITRATRAHDGSQTPAVSTNCSAGHVTSTSSNSSSNPMGKC